MRLLAALLAAASLPVAAGEAAPRAKREPGCEDQGHGPACLKLGEEDWKRGKLRRAAAAFLAACRSDAPEGCAGLAALYAGGRGVPRDDALALATARAGCDRGAAPACANLATLLALGRGAPAAPGEAEALRKAACGAGVAQACMAAGLAAPESAAARPFVLDAAGAPPGGWPEQRAAPRLGPVDDILRDAFRAHRLLTIRSVPPELHAPLGIEPKAFILQESTAEEFDASRIALRVLARDLRPCAEKGGTGKAMVAWATFVPDVAEAVADVRVAGDDLAPEVAACLKEGVAKWELRGMVRAGGRYLVEVPAVAGDPLPVVADGPPGPGAAEDGPREATGGFTAPTVRDRACLGRVSLPDGLEWPAERAEFRFVVTAEGKVSRFRPLTAVTAPVARAVERAVAACDWTPGKDPEGKAVSLWVVLPFRFAR